MNVSAKAVILELLAAGPSIYDKSIPVRLLVRAASVFDIAENSVRVAVVRLCAEGLLESPERGRYCLGPAAEAVTTKIRGWQTIRDRIGRWDGGWIGVFTADQSRTDRSALRKRLQALKLHGFQPLRPGFHIRPSNLNTPLAELRAALNRLGLEDNSPVFNITKLDTAEDAQARQLWDTESINRVYRDLPEQLNASYAELDAMPLNQSIREAFLLAREAVRWVVLDPLLPDPLVNHADRDALLETLIKYNDKALELWARFVDEQ